MPKFNPNAPITPVKFDPSAEITPVGDDQAAPDFTTNTVDPATGKGYGLYRMGSYDFDQGQVTKPEIQVPFNRVQDAQAAGYKLHPDEAPRYQNDTVHNGPAAHAAGYIKDLLSRMTATMPDTPLEGSAWQKANAAMGNVEKLPFNAANRTVRDLAGLPQGLAQTAADAYHGNLEGLNPVYMAEGMAHSYSDDANSIGPVAALGNLGGDAMTMYLAGKAGQPIVEGASNLASSAIESARVGPKDFMRRIAGTGPGVARGLVRQTEDTNRGIVRDNAGKQAEAQSNWEEKQAAATAEHQKKLTELRQKFEDDVRKGEWEARVGTAKDQKAYWDKRRADKQVYDKAVSDQVQKFNEDRASAQQANAEMRAEFVRKEAEARKADAAQAAADAQKQVLARGQQNYVQRAMVNAKETFKTTKARLDKRFNGLRDLLGDKTIGSGSVKGKPIGSDAIEQSIEEAKDKFLMGAPESIKQFNDVMNLMTESNRDDPFPKIRPLSWQEARVHYTALGDRMYSGDLPGNVRKAVELVHDTIDKQLERVAEKNKRGKEYRSARDDWSQFKKDWDDMSNTAYAKSAMGEAGSPLARLVRAADPDAAARALGNDRIMDQLARYKQHGANVGLAQGFRELGKRAAGIENVPKASHPTPITPKPTPTAADYKPPVKPSPVEAEMPPPPRKPPKPLPPDELFKSAPVVPYKEPKLTPPEKISYDDMQRANETGFNRRGQALANYAMRVAGVLGPLRMLGEFTRTGSTSLRPMSIIPAAGMTGLTVEELMSNPGVRDFFTKPTRAQLATIPDSLKGQMPEMVEAARVHGVHISPLIAAYAATIQQNRNQRQPVQQQQPVTQGASQ